jgi:methylated-DNA-[protein]-cysteine S-methyltransferase
MAYAPHVVTLQTPVGSIIISGSESVVSRIEISPDDVDLVVPLTAAGHAPVTALSPVMQAMAQLRSYFDGVLRSFDLPLVPLTSPRGEALRAAIASVGYGETLSYGALAKAHDSGARAVGSACARNPYPIVIPCHRITSSGGAAENYSGGRGPKTKAWLNAHEARYSGRTLV